MDIFLKYGAVGVMDSGIGGLTVLNKLLKSFPKLNFIYYGDNQNAPYGNKSIRELKRLALVGIDALVGNGAKIIVVACNTLSTTILDYIKAVSPVPVIPTLPNNKIDKNEFKSPTLIATPNTILSKYVIESFNNFNLVPLPFLAGEIERFIFSPNKISLEKDLNALPTDVDYLYLGCTHYIFLKERINAFLPLVKVADNLSDVASLLSNTLDKTSIKKVIGKRKVLFIGGSHNYNYTVFKKVLWSKGDGRTDLQSLKWGVNFNSIPIFIKKFQKNY